MKRLIVLLICSMAIMAPRAYAGMVPKGGEAATQPGSSDVLNLAAGAVVLSSSSQYDEKSWSALSLLDDTTKTGWCTAKNAPFPHEVVIELPKTTLLESIVLDNTNAQEGSYPGISARKIDVYASTTAFDQGFKKIIEAEAKKGARSEFKVPANTRARWIKLVVRSNWGDSKYTELMELEAYGRPVGGDKKQPALAGVYMTNYNLMLFEESGNQVTGCYDWDGGKLTGTTDGRVVQFEWRENEGTQVGTAVMVLSAKGDFINGLWYEGGRLQGIWIGNRAGPGEKPKCKARGKNSIEKALAESGRAITYGIQFAVNSDKIEPSSKAVLNEALALLKARKSLNLVIEGHTDSTASDSYNLDLSRRRAKSVVGWLVGHGVESSRLAAKGYGESRPVADNNTVQGRSLNRRVELVRR